MIQSTDPQLLEVRRQNLRTLIREFGGHTALARRLALSGPSYLSQLLGGRRPINEKTARKFEQKLHLAAGFLDQDKQQAPQQAAVDENLVEAVVMAVGRRLQSEGLPVEPAQFAKLVTIIYGDAIQRGAIDEALLETVVSLLK